jgi:dTDP-4-amino-4,6-dideoxygalactose transaminase
MIPIAKPYIGDAEKNAVLEVLDSGMLAQGKKTARFEEEFAAVCGVKHAVATASGTTALHAALLAHGIGPGDEVITTPFTFIATVNSILFTGAQPVFVDIEEDTFNINSELVEKAITPRTKAIMPVHLYGHPCEMSKLMEIVKRHNLILIEDAAQSIGAEYNGQRTGGFGTGCFSLYATKNVMCGEGGMITTNDDEIAQRCRLLRNHGSQRRYVHEVLGYNFLMNDIDAAIGLVQIGRLGEFTKKRRANAQFLTENITSAITPTVRQGCKHVYHQYTIRLDNGRDRDQAVKQLNQAGIGTGIFYPTLCNKQEFMVERGYGDAYLPVAERMTREVISLPVHPQVSQADLELIASEVNKL